MLPSTEFRCGSEKLTGRRPLVKLKLTRMQRGGTEAVAYSAARESSYTSTHQGVENFPLSPPFLECIEGHRGRATGLTRVLQT